MSIADGYPGVLGFRNAIADDQAAQPSVQLTKRVMARIERLRILWELNRAEREEAEDSADFLEEDQADPKWLKPNPNEDPKHWARKELLTADISNKLLGDLATTYRTPPIRTVTIPRVNVEEGDLVDVSTMLRERAAAIAAGNQWYESHIWQYGEQSLDMTGIEIDRWTMYLGITAVEPRYSADFDGMGVDGVEALYYRRHEFEVLTFDNDPRKAEAVVFPIRKVKVKDNVLGDVSQQIFLYYDHEVMCRLTQWVIDQFQGEEDSRFVGGLFEHKLGYMPIVFARERVPTNQFYPSGLHVNLKRTAKSINKLETEFGYVVKQQHGYLYHKGHLEKAAIAVDTVIIGDETSDLKMVQPGANLDGMAMGIQRQIDNTAMLAGLAPGSIVMDSTVAKSGVALIIERSATESVRKERIPRIWSKFEERYNRAAADVYATWGAQPDSVPDGRVQTQFQAPPTGATSDTEKRAGIQFELDKGLTTKHEALRELHPDWTEDQLDERLDAVEETAPGSVSYISLAARKSDREALLLENQLGLLTKRDLLLGLHPDWTEEQIENRIASLAVEKAEAPAGNRSASPFAGRTPLGQAATD